jgi:hypothetical protein
MPIDVPPGRPEGGLDPTNRIKVTGAGPLVVLGLIGLAVGWGARWEAIQVGSPAPSVGWLITAVTWFIVAVTTMIAYLTRRTVAIAPASLTPQQGLFRLVLGKTIARLGAFGLGGFGGIVISRLGVSGEHVGEVITWSPRSARPPGSPRGYSWSTRVACLRAGTPTYPEAWLVLVHRTRSCLVGVASAVSASRSRSRCSVSRLLPSSARCRLSQQLCSVPAR